MALTREIMGCFAIERPSPFLTSSKDLFKQNTLRSVKSRPVFFQRRMSLKVVPSMAALREDLFIKTVPADHQEKKPVKFNVRAVVTVKQKSKEELKDTIVKHLDALTDKIGWNVALVLISTEIDEKTKEPKRSNEAVLKDWLKNSNVKAETVHYTAEFIVDSDFGDPGAITVSNKHQQEFFLENITIEGFSCGPVHFPCNSWVQPKKSHPEERIFFSNKPYLPSETPAGLKTLRQTELRSLRGDGTGERKMSDRIYDFDVYNDLGKPDNGIEFARPTLGGEEIPYPRRCRTGRPATRSDLQAESRVEKPLPMYVPRDEQFEDCKRDTFLTGRLKGVLHNLLPSLTASISANNQDLKCFSDIDSLYSKGLLLKVPIMKNELLDKLPLPKVFSEGLLKFDVPKIISKDKFAWLRDDEFGRQAIAGVNPVSIERLKEFPPVSKLDPEIYGLQESALKEEHILGHIDGMTVKQALEENKLFIIDYHDIYLPFLERINALDGRKAYATRTIFFLTSLGTLKPIAIELSLPPSEPLSRSKRVVTAPVNATSNWIWQLAKAHVRANDAGVHQLSKHWLRTHAIMEVFIISAHRQLSAMHPIFKLLDPHMRYTLDINVLARQNLISCQGVIEDSFTPGRYCMEISAAAYRDWRFDQEGLPADLIHRGIAVPDPTQPHGLKLLIEDYPYASDGLLLWSAIQNWVRTYVNRYYTNSSQICNDKELQAWYSESINEGHPEKRHEEWWPKLATTDDLASILTTIIWLASAQHAALNFGQYPYNGYVPNSPTLMRRLIPEESDPEYANFLADPQKYFLLALPSLLQATKFIAVVDTLSTHSPDEEYIGERQQPSIWTGDAKIIEAFYDFSAEIKRIEKQIEERNNDPSHRNRCGAGVLPYELLAPSSGPGVTCRGVPNSASI